MTRTKPQTTIIGAGLTGPTAALTLARAGHDVTVMEQRPAGSLHSNGIMGIVPAHWQMLTGAGVDLAPYELDNTYRDYELGTVRSPFRLIVWTDLHNAITRTATDAGARFEFETPAIHADHVMGDYVINAGGIVTAARRHLPRTYLGSIIYRGISTLNTPESFTTYKLPGKRGFLDIGQTRAGGSWAFGVRRPEPSQFRTTFTSTPPAEAGDLPAEFRRVVQATPEIMVLPQAGWQIADTCHDVAWQRFTLGDANGPVRPITTSGANLAIRDGLSAGTLLKGSEALARAMLARRAYAIDLGLRLTGPEIGGTLEDHEFAANQLAMYGDGAS